MTVSDDPVRCSRWARAEGLSPIGTAGSYRAVLLLEWEPPWPRAVADIPELVLLQGELARTGTRLQAVLPRTITSIERRAVLYRSAGTAFDAYRGRERVVDRPQLIEAAMALLLDAPGPGSLHDCAVPDVLICTHGRRDVCCGSAGTALAIETIAGGEDWTRGVRLWRTSHLGGHRFAPTALVLPAGTAWAYLDGPSLKRVATGRPSPGDVRLRYRGCTGLGSPAIQALERAVLLREGSAVLGVSRAGAESVQGRVELTVGPGAGRRWTGRVVEGRQMPVPDCGQPISAAKELQTELDIADLELLTPASA